MAVYKQNYKGYNGPRTSRWFRFLVLTRYSYARIFQSRILVLFFAICFFYPLGCAAFIYLSHNSPLLAALQFRTASLPPIDGTFFYTYCMVQGSLAFLMTTLVGPSLIAPDLANGSLALYLSRPFSRAQYVIGKMGVLFILLSLITWIPGLLLFGIQTGCVGWQWARDHLWLAGAIGLGPVIWITCLALLALALSAWVKWKIAAGAAILGVLFAGAGLGSIINHVWQTQYGSLLNLTDIIHTIWADLFRYDLANPNLTVTQAWGGLSVTCLFSLYLLARRIRAFEVVK